jgi:hypothetical protein
MIATIHAWDDLRKRQELFAAMAGDAARSVTDIAITDPPAPPAGYVDRTYALVVAEYAGRFITTAASDMAKSEFTTARQFTDEAILGWHARCRDLYLQAFPGSDANAAGQAGQLLRDRYTRGLDDETIREYVFDHRPATFQDCLMLAQNKMATMQMMDDSRGGKKKKDQSIHFINYSKNNSGNNNANKRPSGPADSRACYLCNEVGHFQHQCPILPKAKMVLDQKTKKTPLKKKRNTRWGPAVNAIEDEGEASEAGANVEVSEN